MRTFLAIEEVSGRYEAVFKDTAGQTVPVGQLSLLKVTLYVAELGDADPTGVLRNDQDLLAGGSGVTFDGDTMIWEMAPSDFQIRTSKPTELHIARIRFEYGTSPVKRGVHLVGWNVASVRRYPAA